ncbi:MAG: hypothetical protein WDO18_05850 [Acidobacteriota bacterium]
MNADIGLALAGFPRGGTGIPIADAGGGACGAEGTTPGIVLLQTQFPDHYAVQCAAEQNYEKFYTKEIEFRRTMHYPPFGAMANVIVRSSKEEEAIARSAELGRLLSPPPEGIKVLGPAPAAVARVKTEYRFQMFVEDVQQVASDGCVERNSQIRRGGKVGADDVGDRCGPDDAALETMAVYEQIYSNLQEAMRLLRRGPRAKARSGTLDEAIAIFSGLEYGVFNICMLDVMPKNVSGEPLVVRALFPESFAAMGRCGVCEDALTPEGLKELRGALPLHNLRGDLDGPWMAATVFAAPRRELPAIQAVRVDNAKVAGNVRRAGGHVFRYSDWRGPRGLLSGAGLDGQLSRIRGDGCGPAGGDRFAGAARGHAGGLLASDPAGKPAVGVRRSAAAGGGGAGAGGGAGRARGAAIQRDGARRCICISGFQPVTKFSVYLTK